jgi:transcription elongation factor
MNIRPQRWAANAALVLACAATPAWAADAMTAQLAGSSEVPAVMSAGTGTVAANLDAAGVVLSWTVTFSGLSGPVTAAHFHGPAVPGKNASVVVPITGQLTSPISGSTMLTPAQVLELKSGQWYFNLHTAANPGGEIRGQVVVSR